jgi:hypothetical protein
MGKRFCIEDYVVESMVVYRNVPTSHLPHIRGANLISRPSEGGSDGASGTASMPQRVALPSSETGSETVSMITAETSAASSEPYSEEASP